MLSTGSPWRDLPEEFEPWKTAWRLFDRKNSEGFVSQDSAPVPSGFCPGGRDRFPTLVHRWHDGAGGCWWKKNDAQEPQDHALGRSRGGLSTKIPILCDGNGLPLSFHLTPGSHTSLPYWTPFCNRPMAPTDKPFLVVKTHQVATPPMNRMEAAARTWLLERDSSSSHFSTKFPSGWILQGRIPFRPNVRELIRLNNIMTTLLSFKGIVCILLLSQ